MLTSSLIVVVASSKSKNNQNRTLLLVLVQQLHRQLKGLVLPSEARPERQGHRAPRRDRGGTALEGRRKLREVVRHRFVVESEKNEPRPWTFSTFSIFFYTSFFSFFSFSGNSGLPAATL